MSCAEPPELMQARSDRNVSEVRTAKRWNTGARLQLGLPIAVWALALAVPYLLMLIISFWPSDQMTGMHPGLTLDNWTTVFIQPLYRDALLRSLGIAFCVTALSVGICYPVAYFIATRVTSHKALIYVLLQVPLWTAYLIRAYAWRVILGENGVIAKALDSFGITDTPDWLLFSNFAVVIVISTMFVPFTIATMFPALEAIPPDLREASKDLHAGRIVTFLKVTWPLSMPAAMAAALYTLAISFGDFIAPTLVGGPQSIMMTQLIFNQIGVAFDWPLAASLSLTMFIVIVPLVILSQRAEASQAIGLRR
jgi:spermidine/putrescine transport system permease protein